MLQWIQGGLPSNTDWKGSELLCCWRAAAVSPPVLGAGWEESWLVLWSLYIHCCFCHSPVSVPPWRGFTEKLVLLVGSFYEAWVTEQEKEAFCFIRSLAPFIPIVSLNKRKWEYLFTYVVCWWPFICSPWGRKSHGYHEWVRIFLKPK